MTTAEKNKQEKPRQRDNAYIAKIALVLASLPITLYSLWNLKQKDDTINSHYGVEQRLEEIEKIRDNYPGYRRDSYVAAGGAVVFGVGLYSLLLRKDADLD